ncbi:cytochrome C oxidase subunit IV family protein [Pasteuria penetrans]|uniref:cytochrome C oxidase subunit IV family protein n=1 Tax=Pasteuria penetrans TaxID=86005 RepID=UPI00165C90A3|nr:cytochrome C oxidase subunit IV family protein [Pasteuria penetrans]
MGQRQSRLYESMIKVLASFFLMVALTALAFYVVASPFLASRSLLLCTILIVLATVQVFLQFYTFMHLNERGTTFYKIFLYAGIVIALISAVGTVAPG